MTDPSAKFDCSKLTGKNNLILPLLLDRFLVGKKEFATRHLIGFIRDAGKYQQQPSIELAQELFDTYLQLPTHASPLQAKHLVIDPTDKLLVSLVEAIRKKLRSEDKNLFIYCVQALLQKLNLVEFQKSTYATALEEIAALQMAKEATGKTHNTLSPEENLLKIDTESLIISYAKSVSELLKSITQEGERTQIDYITWKAERIIEDLFLTHPLVLEAENRLYTALISLTKLMIKEGTTKENLELWRAIALMLTSDSTLPDAERLTADLLHLTIDVRKALTDKILTDTLIKELKGLKSEKRRLVEVAKQELRCQLAVVSLPNRMIEWKSPNSHALFDLEPLPCKALPGIKIDSAKELHSLLAEVFSRPFSTLTVRRNGEGHAFNAATQVPEKANIDQRMKICFNGVFALMVKALIVKECDNPYDAIFLKDWESAQEMLTCYPWFYYLLSFLPSFHKQWEGKIWDDKHGYGKLESKCEKGLPTLTIDIGFQEIMTRYGQTYEVPLANDKAQLDLIISQEFSKKFFCRGSARMGHLQMPTFSSNRKEREKLLKILTEGLSCFSDTLFTDQQKYSSHELRASYASREYIPEDKEEPLTEDQ